MIVISEPSTQQAARRIRTGKSPQAHSRNSAIRNGTHGQSGTRPLSVHTEEHTLSKINNPVPPAGLAPGWPQAGREGGGSPGGAGIPSRRRQRRSGPGAGGKVVHRMRCSTLPPAPGPLRDEPADATGYPLPDPPVLRSGQPTSCCPRAVSSGQQRSTAVTNGAPRYTSPAAQRASPGRGDRFPSSRRIAGCSWMA
jgi:hypothetical protein